jgi:hypothetical protein
MNVTKNAFDEPAKSRATGAFTQSADEELRLARERLSTEIQSVFRRVKRSLYVERQILGLALFDAGFRAAAYFVALLCTLVVALGSTWFAVASVRRGLYEWTRGAWWSDLVLAALLFGALAIVSLLVRRGVHRAALRRTQHAMGQPDLPETGHA